MLAAQPAEAASATAPSLVAQAPAPSPVPSPVPETRTGTEAQPVPGPAGGSDVANWIGGGVGLAVLLLFAYALARKRARRRAELQEPTVGKRLEAKKERVEPAARPEPEAIPAPRRRERPVEVREPTEAEEAADRAVEEADAARLEAKRLLELARQTGAREDAERAEAAKQAALRTREQAEALQAEAEADLRRRKEEVEERKKADYRARKEQEAAEKERRRQEAEEARKRAEEEARQKALAEEEVRRQAEEAERRKVQAQAGKTLSEGLAKTRGGFVANLNAFLGRTKVLDESVLGELEEVLFSADIGVRTATALLDYARDRLRAKDLSDPAKLKDAIRDRVRQIVEVQDGARDVAAHKPYVLMVVGVNGSGKTTTIGKLAAKHRAEGRKVLLAAGDTFRAAATEQLEVWGGRSDTPVVKGKEGADPGSVIFDAIKRAQAEGYDLLICDTAGRLHTKAPLMEEIKRVKRVMDKAMPGTPHETLLVLDSTNGQNAIAQAREFHAALGVDGIVLTKLDGTAKGGVVIGICDELKLPVRYIGIGESVPDLRPFEPKAFVEALFD